MVNLYFDESGSIDNKSPHMPHFVIAMVRVTNKEKLQRAYKRFVSSNFERLQELDQDKTDENGRVLKPGGKMFKDGKFRELKGAQFDSAMKRKFVEFFSRNDLFELYYIRFDNKKLKDALCENTARAFNYALKLAMVFYIKNGYLPNDSFFLQLDERNEKTDTRYFLENYLNTELIMDGTVDDPFTVQYFDSATNHFIQIADVFANLYYSELRTNAYGKEFDNLKEKGILKHTFVFPLN